MIGLFRYLFLSKNKALYRTIAREFHSHSWKVYRLAHGKRARSNKDYAILKRLRERDIIESVFRIG